MKTDGKFTSLPWAIEDCRLSPRPFDPENLKATIYSIKGNVSLWHHQLGLY